MKNETRYRIDQIRRRNIPKEYKKTKLGILPADWNVYTLGNCLQRVERPVKVKPDELYIQIGIRSHGKGLFYKGPVTGTELGNKPVFWIVPDCFILNIVFAWEQAIGKTTLSEAGMIGSHRFPMYRPINNAVNIDYLISYFLTKRGTDILEAASPGGAGRNKTLGQNHFLKSKIVLPPIAEQQKIAEILIVQDKIIELKEKLITEKQRQKKYMMQQLLTGKKRLQEFSDIWKNKKLGDICCYSSKRGRGKLGTYVSTENMRPNLEGKVLFNSDDECGQEVDGIIYASGDILIANIRPYLKKVWKANVRGVCSSDVLVLHPTAISSDFLYCLIANDDFFSYVMTSAKGSKMPRGDKKHIMNMNVMLPPQKEQCAIINIGNLIKQECDLLQQSLEQEKQKKKALMQLLLTGIVRVNVS